uniref:Uncharacterized protein n=1 Tax=Anguilla anguilla TaxID=7936 RepID=A0A0E9UUT1_ANGAN
MQNVTLAMKSTAAFYSCYITINNHDRYGMFHH